MFKNIKITKGKLISKIASCSLAAYIIHENSFIRCFIFIEIFKENMFYNSKWLVIHQLVTCVCILLICTIIELIRRYIFDKTINVILDKFKLINTKIVI